MDESVIHLQPWLIAAAATHAIAASVLLAAVPAPAPLLREAPQAWRRGLALLALGWLPLTSRGAMPDLAAIAGAAALIALGAAECARAQRRLAGLPEARNFWLGAVAAVLATGIVSRLPWSSRSVRLEANTSLLAPSFLFGAAARAGRDRAWRSPEPAPSPSVQTGA